MRSHAKFFSVGAVLGAALFLVGCAAAPPVEQATCWGQTPWTERLVDLMRADAMEVRGVDDRAGWMERWNAVPPATRFPVPDAIFWFTTPRAVGGAVGVVFVHDGCEVYTELVTPDELAYLLGFAPDLPARESGILAPSTTPAPSPGGLDV